jgi:1,4-alpha-glucan branching enzyme
MIHRLSGTLKTDCGTPARECQGVAMINKQPQRGGRVKVTFTVPVDQPELEITVVGDFNGWDPQATPLKRRGKRRTVSVTLDGGRRYAFRYRRANGKWFNDEAADDYEPNEYGGYNCVIDLAGIQ